MHMSFLALRHAKAVEVTIPTRYVGFGQAERVLSILVAVKK